MSGNLGGKRRRGMPQDGRKAFARGYSEIALGLPFAQRDYDGMPQVAQQFYEFGRLEAANVKAAGLRVDRDKGSRAALEAISASIFMARVKLGWPVPPEAAA